VTHLPLAFHDPQQSLNRLVVRARTLARRSHNVINGPFANAPQDLQQSKFCGRGKYQLLILPDFPHRDDCATEEAQGQRYFKSPLSALEPGKHGRSCASNKRLSLRCGLSSIGGLSGG
jgi:hypothetical protein